MSVARRRPYTESGLARVTCSIPDCERPATDQWQVRSCTAGGGTTWRAVCRQHDRRLNRYVMRVFGLAVA